MSDNFNKNRIVKNSLLLYVRMLFTMWINLWATRLVLANLGVEDYGIYGVVGSTVSLFAVLNGGMTNAINRFLAFELGKQDGEINKVFCNCINIVIGLSILTLIILESVGLWFLRYKLQIPVDKVDVAFWVFQFSTIVCIVNLLSIPYNAMIIAKEKMGAFAYISIIQVILNFISIYLLKYIEGNRLFWYALFLLGVAVLFRLINQAYCRIKFDESKYHFCHSTKVVKSIGKFMGFSMMDGIVTVIYAQGCVFIINMAYGVFINGVYNIAVQVRTYMLTFSQNIQKAIEPQITKNYAANDNYHFNLLINKGSMFQTLLSIVFMIPMLFRTKQILSLWLGHVPEHLCTFVQTVVFVSLLFSITCPIITGALATGKIKKFLLVGNCIYVVALGVFYILSQNGISVEQLVCGFVLVELIVASYRVYQLSMISNFSLLFYIKRTFIPCFVVGSITFGVMLLINRCFSETIMGLVLYIVSSTLIIAILSYIICLNTKEKSIFNSLVLKLLK